MFASWHSTPIHVDGKEAKRTNPFLARSATARTNIYMTGAVRSDPS